MVIKLIVWDLDDTLIFAEKDDQVGLTPKKFLPVGVYDTNIGPERVVDGPNMVQILMKHVREVLTHLQSLGICMTFGSMGPEFQMRRFMRAFKLEQFFDWEIGSYDRRDKGEKVELCIDHYNSRLASEYLPYESELENKIAKQSEVIFIDDNLGYIGRVNEYLPDVIVIWAHFRGDKGVLALYDDLWLQYKIDLSPSDYELPEDDEE